MQDYAWEPTNGWSSSRVLRYGSQEVATLRRSAWWSGTWNLAIGPRTLQVRPEGILRWHLLLLDGPGAPLAELRFRWSGVSEVAWRDGRKFLLRRPSFWNGAWAIEEGAGAVAEVGGISWTGRSHVRLLGQLTEADLACLLALQAVLLTYQKQAHVMPFSP